MLFGDQNRYNETKGCDSVSQTLVVSRTLVDKDSLV
jgi:hypothetical protein